MLDNAYGTQNVCYLDTYYFTAIVNLGLLLFQNFWFNKLELRPPA